MPSSRLASTRVAESAVIQGTGHGKQLQIEIPKPADTIECEGQIRWCAQSAKNDAHFYVGIRFEALDPLAQKKIARMRDWFTSANYRAKSTVRKDASSAQLRARRP